MPATTGTTPTPPHPSFAALASYLELGITAVEGWLSPTTAAMLAHVLVRQVQQGVGGDVCEIGVHHGKLFIVLANATVAGEAAVAVDVFDQQEKNIDQSGRGDRAVFEGHVAAYAPGAALHVIQGSSLDLHTPEFLAKRFRFVSIDGGHTAAAAENDLWLAQHTLTDGGIVALDDILSAHWTGVLTGLVRYRAGGGTLVPFALVPNKLLLAQSPRSAEHWRAELRRHFPLGIAKTDLEFLGALVESFNEHPYYSREGHTGLLLERDALRRDRDAASARADAAEQRAAALEHTASALRAEAEAARQLLAATHDSTSWRSTGPLRALASLAKRPR